MEADLFLLVKTKCEHRECIAFYLNKSFNAQAANNTHCYSKTQGYKVLEIQVAFCKILHQ